MRAGDVLIFTEALTHGARPWTAPYQRRTLLFKYAPGCMAWSSERWPASFTDQLTPVQQRLCRPPFEHEVTAPGHGFRTAAADPVHVPLLDGPEPG
jgi:hypothetical protein